MIKEHIALFMPSFAGGGAERVMVTLANELAERGHRIDLIVVSASGPYQSDVDARVRVIDLGARRVIKSCPSLIQYLRRERPAVLLSTLQSTNVVAVMARYWAQGTTRVVVREATLHSHARAHSRILRERWMHHFMRWAYPRADAIVAISQGVADDLAKLIGIPSASMRVIYNPVVTSELLSAGNERMTLDSRDEEQCAVVLGAGRLVESKDFATLIRAFSHLVRRRRARLVILGEGESRSDLEELADMLGVANQVELPGFVTNPHDYMRRASVFVQSCRWEGFGNVLVEAMACGLPVVSTDCPGGPAEILENGKWGTLVQVGDPDELARAIDDALDIPCVYDVRARAQDFTAKAITDEYIRALGLR